MEEAQRTCKHTFLPLLLSLLVQMHFWAGLDLATFCQRLEVNFACIFLSFMYSKTSKTPSAVNPSRVICSKASTAVARKESPATLNKSFTSATVRKWSSSDAMMNESRISRSSEQLTRNTKAERQGKNYSNFR